MLLGPDVTSLEPSITGLRAEREVERSGFLERAYRVFTGLFNPGFGEGTSPEARRFTKRVSGYADALSVLDDEALQARVSDTRFNLRKHGLKSKWVAQAFALIREIAERELGQRHYDTQVVGGWLLLRGLVAEMPTGEGKTLTATLTAGTAAMAGLPVHVLTVNDYLTARDAHEMGPVYRALGLSVGVIVHGAESDERQRAYTRDVVYCTSKEVVFDYLRDRIVLSNRRQSLRQKVEPLFGTAGCHKHLLTQGLHFAIVDEADSVLIDEARTPLIISGPEGGQYERQFLQQALEIAGKLSQGVDFKLNEADRRIELQQEGIDDIKKLSRDSGPLWSGKIRREEVISQALSAMHLFHLDKQYLIRDGKVEIIDQLSGRVAEGRSWERGLHQLIELKEGCEMSQQQSTLARISYQSFFQRYLHLSGMTGTAHEVRRELWQVYHLPVASVSPNRPCIRKTESTKVVADTDTKWRLIAERAKTLVEAGRAVLIGTSSVAASEALAAWFKKAGIGFNLLNAKQDREEAEIIAQAGQPSRITIATSMAGRGTDIKLAEEVKEAGGLHVILSERFDAARVDRQLAGRCARQGDPGSFEAILCPRDTQFTDKFSRWLASIAIMSVVKRGIGKAAALAALRMEQKRRERKSYRERTATRKYDQQQEDLLSISGRGE
ncbi:MAG: hypothetical protein ABW162_10805 [Candidatus Sedimenticola sp. PURPLELP]